MPDQRSQKILLIDDNRELSHGLRNKLEFDQYDVELAGSGEAGLELMDHYQPDLLILELVLSEMDGYHVLDEIRGRGDNTPVLILSVLDDEVDKIRAFRLGADDYVTKPFDILVLIERIRAILRRSSLNEQDMKEWKFGDVVVDQNRREVLKEGDKVRLSPLEYDLLITLLKRNGSVADRDELLAEVWNQTGDVVTRTVDTHISELRKKLEKNPSSPQFLKTVPKVGYQMVI